MVASSPSSKPGRGTSRGFRLYDRKDFVASRILEVLADKLPLVVLAFIDLGEKSSPALFFVIPFGADTLHLLIVTDVEEKWKCSIFRNLLARSKMLEDGQSSPGVV